MKNNSYFKSEEELKENAPLLFGIPKENPFSVPDNYFDALPTQVQERYLASGKEAFTFQLILRSWYQSMQKRPLYAIATVTLFLVVSFGLVQIIQLNSGDNEISNSIQANSLLQPEDQLDEEVLADALVEQGYFEEAKKTVQTKAEDQKIINYLLNENIEVATITEEL